MVSAHSTVTENLSGDFKTFENIDQKMEQAKELDEICDEVIENIKASSKQ